LDAADSMTHRERFMAALKGERVDRVAVFPLLMFFAADRAGISYREFASSGRALARAQLSVRERFDLDAITACSDAFRVSADLGGEMAVPELSPPHLVRPLVSGREDVKSLGRPDPTSAGGRMADRVLAVSEMVRASGGEFVVLGWVDMPFAECCSVAGVSQFMMMLVDDPATAHELLDHLTGIVIDFALAQLEAGADMIGAGAASLVSDPMYREFALPYQQRVCDAIHSAGGLVKLHICGNTSALVESMVESGADLFNVDHMVPFGQARDVYSRHGKCFKGNLDPVEDMLRATPETCRAAAHGCIALARGSAYMLSAGCEVPAGTTDEVFDAFRNAPATFVDEEWQCTI
jgi:MtaA/CmuA family methyltransferase